MPPGKPVPDSLFEVLSGDYPPPVLMSRLAGAAVLVIGDVMLDRFVYGAIMRISPESAAPVLSQHQDHIMPGGAGNVLANLAGLGVRSTLLAIAGDDEPAEQLRTLCQALPGAPAIHILNAPDRPTSVKTRYLDKNRHVLRVDRERTAPLPADLRAELLRKAQDLIKDVQAVILSDYGKGVLGDGIAAALIEMAAEHNVPVLVDPKGTDFSKYRGAFAVTPNRKELAATVQGLKLHSAQDIESAAGALIKNAGLQAIIATRSEDGLSVIAEGAPAFHIKATAAPADICDVSGAGDTVIATLAAGLAAGLSLPVTAALANEAAGLVVIRPGTTAITAPALQKRLESLAEHTVAEQTRTQDRTVADDQDSTNTHHHILPPDWQAAQDQIRRWQQAGLRVGFTNGCFDILHYGHVTYLARAKELCDRLVVGINADSSVRRLKGPQRPVNDEVARSAVMDALACIDMTVLFGRLPEESDTASLLIDTLRPDLYVKGGDYKIEDIPEAQIVQNYGGTVRLMDLYDGHSTTGMIAKIKK